MPNNLEWIVGPVHTGKTTRLGNRISSDPENYCGLLAPVDSEGKRYLQDIVTGERRILDCSQSAIDAITVGPYTFSEEVFAWGRSILQAHHEQYAVRNLVIDELGKLELKKIGLAPYCWELLFERQARSLSSIIVVRDSLKTAVDQHLKLKA